MCVFMAGATTKGFFSLKFQARATQVCAATEQKKKKRRPECDRFSSTYEVEVFTHRTDGDLLWYFRPSIYCAVIIYKVQDPSHPTRKICEQVRCHTDRSYPANMICCRSCRSYTNQAVTDSRKNSSREGKGSSICGSFSRAPGRGGQGSDRLCGGDISINFSGLCPGSAEGPQKPAMTRSSYQFTR